MSGGYLKSYLDGDPEAERLLLEGLDAPLRERFNEARSKLGDLGVAFDDYARHVLRKLAGRAAQLKLGLELADLQGLLRLAWTSDLYLTFAMGTGHDAAWRMFMDSFGGKVDAMVRGQTSDAGLSEAVLADVVGDLFFSDREAGSSRLMTYSGAGSLDSWLWVVLKGRIIDSFRRHRNELKKFNLIGGGDMAADAIDGLPKAVMEEGPEDRVLDAENLEMLRLAIPRAFRTLDSRDRVLLKLRYLDGISQRRLASLHDIDPSRICRWLKRARQSIRDETERILMREFRLSEPETAELLNLILDDRLTGQMSVGFDSSG